MDRVVFFADFKAQRCGWPVVCRRRSVIPVVLIIDRRGRWQNVIIAGNHQYARINPAVQPWRMGQVAIMIVPAITIPSAVMGRSKICT